MKKSSTLTLVLFLYFVPFLWRGDMGGLRAQTGLDLAFGNNGLVLNSVPDYYSGYLDIALQSDNKILTVGNLQVSGKFVTVVHRYLPNGKVDSTFASKGTFTTSIKGEARGNSIDVRSDGKILVTGYTRFWNAAWFEDMYAIRLKATGILDSTFSTNGIFVSNISTGNSAANYGLKILKEQDSSIVIAGYHRIGAGTGYAAFKIKYSGQFDATFGNNGYANFTFLKPSWPYGFNIQNDGKILMTGSYLNGSGEILTARINKRGNLDSTFGNNGTVITSFTKQSSGSHISQLPNGNVLISGLISNGSDSDFLLLQMNSVGKIDSTFGTYGIVKFDNGYYEYPIYHEVTTNNNIYLMGRTGLPFGVGPYHHDYILMNFNSQGKVDSSFASNGKFIVDFSGYADVPNCSEIQADGKILIAGSSYDSLNSVSYFNMTRIFNNTVGIKKISKDDSRLLVYPSPATDYAIIDLSEFHLLKSVFIEIRSILGEVIFNARTTSLKYYFNTNEYLPGVYYISIKTETEIVAEQKLIIIK